MSDGPEIRSRSLADANRDIQNFDNGEAVISIGSPNATEPEGLDPSNPLHLRLRFDDVTTDSPTFQTRKVHPPEREHIERLIERADDLLASGYVYCHCAAGISRSTAAAFILRCLRRPPGEEKAAMRAVLEDNPFAAPNRRMVALADELLERDGEMLAAIAAVTRKI